MPCAFDADLILSKPLMASLGSVSADNAPCTAPVWFLWEHDVCWMLGGKSNSSVRRLTENPRCSVEITDFDVERGILLHAGLRGHATVEPMDAQLFRRLLTKYLGPEPDWNPWFIENIAAIDDPDGRLIRLEPDSIFTNNVSYFRSGPDIIAPS